MKRLLSMFWAGNGRKRDHDYIERVCTRIILGALFLRRRVSLPTMYHKYWYQGQWYILVEKRVDEFGRLDMRLEPYEKWRRDKRMG